MLRDLLELVQKKQQQGLSVSDDEALDVLGRDEFGALAELRVYA